MDNTFIERLWRSLKYEEVYLKAYETVDQACKGIDEWMMFYNGERRHQGLDNQTPDTVYAANLEVGYGGMKETGVRLMRVSRNGGTSFWDRIA